jgi:hypothetical protein
LYGLTVGTVGSAEGDGDNEDGAYGAVPANFASRISDSLKKTLEMPPYDNTLNMTAQNDNMAKYKERYQAMGLAPTQTRYGWVRTSL